MFGIGSAWTAAEAGHAEVVCIKATQFKVIVQVTFVSE
jgi:hypothetical protein